MWQTVIQLQYVGVSGMNKKGVQKILATLSLVFFVVTWYFTFGVNPLGWNDALTPAAQASTITWIGGSTGTWENSLNWSGGAVPTSADDVTIASTTANISVEIGTTANFNTLSVGGTASTTITLTLTGSIGTGGSITVGAGGVLVQNNNTMQTISGTLTAEATSTITHTLNTPSSSVQTFGLLFTAGGYNFQTSSVVSVSAKGFNRGGCSSSATSHGLGPARGFGASPEGSGGGHGGVGGRAADNTLSYSDFVYDNVSQPTEYGSSGGNAHFVCGGFGGGAIKFVVTGGGSAIVNGTVSADGSNGTSANDRHPGGGAGGALWFDFSSGGTITGGGTISAVGGAGGPGNAFDDGGGGGGGGRIAITGHSTDTFSGTFRYYGGNGGSSLNDAKDGGGGTLLKKTSSATNPDLYIQNATSTHNTPTYSSTTLTVANLYLSDNAYFQITSSTTFTITSSSLGSSSVSTTLNLEGSLVTPSNFTVTGKNYVIASPNFISGITDLTIATSAIFSIKNFTTTSAWSLNSLTVAGTLTTPTNTASILNAINISAPTITVTASGTISVDGKGYAGGTGMYVVGGGGTTSTLQVNGLGPGGGVHDTNVGGGGAYGGAGGVGSETNALGGSVYGTTNTPEFDAGSGGGGGYYDTIYGGAGGGVVKLSGTTVTINGVLSANGQAGTHGCGGIPVNAGGGGSGGGIMVSATTISGNGSITANGGNGGNGGSTCSGGGGGGGRVLLVSQNYSFTGTATTSPGVASSFVGTTATAGIAGTTALSPYPPSNLYTGTTTAQTGSTNPTQLPTTTPYFSAIFSDPEVSDTAARAHIQVSTSSSFATITHWDSGSTGTPITSCSNGARCQDIKYGSFGSAPTLNLGLNDDGRESATQTVYYWRIRFFDARVAAGNYSTTTATFTIMDAPNPATSVVSSTVATSSIIWAWTDNSAIETGYEYSTSTDGSTFGTANTVSASVTTGTDSGLSPNTAHYLRVRATGTAGNSDYATSSVVYTLANPPASASAIAGTSNAATITWSANSNASGTEYYVEDAGNAANNSGWVTSTAYTFTNLTAGTGYTFNIKARNAQTIETTAVTASVTTQSGSTDDDDDVDIGGGCTTPECNPRPNCPQGMIGPNCDVPVSGVIKITKTVGGSEVILTNQRNVFVELNAKFADMVALKASDGGPTTDFSGASFEPIKSAVAWTLNGADGQKCVNARFINSASQFIYTTYACTTLDTTPPVTPTFYITGVSATGVVTGNPRVSSLVTTEPNTRLTLVFKKGGVTLGTFYTQTDGVGNWTQLLAGSSFTPGVYELEASLSDSAGNTSDVAQLSVTVTRGCTGSNCNPDPKCPTGTSGVYPDCKPDVDEPKCPAGTSGVYPNCKPDKPDPKCPAGTSGVYPNCKPDVEGPKCPEGTTGTYPQCKPVGDDDKPCTGPNCPAGGGDNGGDGNGGDNGGDNGNGGNDGNGGADDSNGNGGSGSGSGSGSDSSDTSGVNNPNNSGAGTNNGGVGGAIGDGEEVTIPTTLTPTKPVVDTRSPAAQAVTAAVDKAVEFVSDPQVQTVNKVGVAPTLVVTAVANALAGAGAASMLNFLHFVFAQPILALRRRNAKAWGVVYNAYSKLPVDLAAVRLVDADTGRVVQSQVTDLQGRYFMATPDPAKKYRLEVSKAGYKGIADLGQTDDAPFLNLYKGAVFAAAAERPEISYSIPLEPDAGNPSALQIIRQKTKKALHRAASSFGLVFSVISFVITPSILIGVFVGIHALVYGLFYIVGYKLKPDAWGVVRDKAQKTRLGRVVVRVFDAAYNKLVSTAVTDGNGRYAVLVGPSKFIVTYEKIGYDKAQSDPLDFTPEKTKGRGGIINRSEVLQKSN